MVFTPTQRAHTGPGGCPSPLILATHPPSFSPLPTAALHSATSGSSTPNSAIPPIRRFSTSSFSKLSEFHLDDDPEPINGAAANAGAGAGAGGSASSTKHMTPSRQASYNSVSGLENGVKGVRYVDLSLDPSEWRVHVFKKKVLAILRKLRVPRWDNPDILSSYVHLQKVSGAMTNAVFFVSFNPSRNPTSPSMSPLLTPTMPPSDPDLPLSPAQFPPTLLLRIYGPSSDALISRTEELRILHVLSTQYGLGPKVFGTFANGRVEQFFPSRALTSQELRDKAVSRGIARRMRELHSVDMMALGYQEEDLEVPTVWKSINEWIPAAKEVLTTLGAHGGRWEMWVENVALHRLPEEIETYKKWMMEQESSRLVFAHNDTQYGNLLLLENPIPGSPDHYKYIVIDFEYAAPNPRGYDIANHFHEWRANYHHATLSHSLQPHYPYPSPEARENFYRAYLSLSIDPVKGAEGEPGSGNGASNGTGSGNGSVPTAQFRPRKDIEQEKVDKLEREVRAWSPAASAFWALWGIIQAEEMIANMDKEHEFDYLAYASERLDMFRKEAKELGVPI